MATPAPGVTAAPVSLVQKELVACPAAFWCRQCVLAVGAALSSLAGLHHAWHVCLQQEVRARCGRMCLVPQQCGAPVGGVCRHQQI
jgi:hypothetical protein